MSVREVVRIPSHRLASWLYEHPSRLSWVLIELLRPFDWRRRLSNAWWQARHYGGTPPGWHEFVDRQERP